MRYADAMHKSAYSEVEDADPAARVGNDRVARPNETNLGPWQEREIDGAAETGEGAHAPIGAAVDLGDGAKARICS
jgi:hypothetical protein